MTEYGRAEVNLETAAVLAEAITASNTAGRDSKVELATIAMLGLFFASSWVTQVIREASNAGWDKVSMEIQTFKWEDLEAPGIKLNLEKHQDNE